MTTVIIPYYRRKKTLDNAILSCYKIDTLKEIIIVDDEQSESSAKLLSNIKEKNNQVRVVKNKFKGAYHARITGFYNQSDEVILFLDSDDTFLPDINNLISKYAQYKKQILVCSSYYVDSFCVKHPKNINHFHYLYKRFSGSPFSSIALFNVEILPWMNLDLKAYQDDDFCLRCQDFGIEILFDEIVTSRLNTKHNGPRISDNYFLKHKNFSKFVKSILPILLREYSLWRIIFLLVIYILNQVLLILSKKLFLRNIYIILKKIFNEFIAIFAIGKRPL